MTDAEGNLTGQAQGQIIPLALFCPTCAEQHVDEGEWETRPHRTHLCLHCGTEWEVTVRGAEFIDARTRDLEARLSQALEENGDLRDRADDHRQMYFELEEAKKRIAELEHEVTCAEADTKDALEAARVAEAKAALADEAAEHVRHGSDRRERFDWLNRYDKLLTPAADAATGETP